MDFELNERIRKEHITRLIADLMVQNSHLAIRVENMNRCLASLIDLLDLDTLKHEKEPCDGQSE